MHNTKRNPMHNTKQSGYSRRDRCILCGKPTVYTEETPISERSGYVENAGQLCPDCYNKVYPRTIF